MATRKTRRFAYTVPYWIFELAFWLIVIIGIAMAAVGIMHAAHISWNLFDTFANWVEHICMTIALFIPVFLSFHVARYKGTAWFIVWIISAILVVVGIITRLI